MLLSNFLSSQVYQSIWRIIWQNLLGHHVCTKGTYASKIFVQKLYVSMDDFQCHQFIVSLLHSTAKVQTSISKNKNDIWNFRDNKLTSFKHTFCKQLWDLSTPRMSTSLAYVSKYWQSVRETSFSYSFPAVTQTIFEAVICLDGWRGS